MQGERIHGTGVAIGVALTLGGVVALGVPAATAKDSGGPQAHAAQWEDPPWNCKHFTRLGSGSTASHRVGTWGPGGLRFYRIKVRVRAQRCRRWTRILYYPYVDARNLPRDRKVLIQFQSRGPYHRWKPACINGRCTFSVKGGSVSPAHFGARPVWQYRVTRRHLLTRTRFPNGAVQEGAGTWVAGPPKTYRARIHYYR